jgi:hypothetical protein
MNASGIDSGFHLPKHVARMVQGACLPLAPPNFPRLWTLRERIARLFRWIPSSNILQSNRILF